jgi:hypothetical protein
MATHPEGIVVDIVGIEEPSRGRSCELHDVCGSNLILDCVVRIRKVQIVNDDGREETALAAYWVTDGVDLCRVGFLPRHYIKQADKFDGKLAQITEFLYVSENPSERRLSHRNRGMCRAAVITGGPEFGDFSPTIKKMSRRFYKASCQLDELSSGPMAEETVALEKIEHDKKIGSKKRSSVADGTDAQQNAKLTKKK